MKKIIAPIALAAILVTSFTSCKKDEKISVPTAQELILGKWNVIYLENDKNENGIIEPNEIFHFPTPAGERQIDEYRSDKTCTSTIYDKIGGNLVFNYNYELMNDGKELKYYVGNDAAILTIVTLTADKLEVKQKNGVMRIVSEKMK